MVSKIRLACRSTALVGLCILLFWSVENSHAQSLPPLTSTMADVDLSSVKAASLTHWKTLYSTDPQVLRAQFQADKGQAHTLDVVIDSWIANNQYNVALLKRFGEKAYSGGGLVPPPDRKVFESIQWNVVGDRGIPVDPPRVTGERCMVRVGDRWLMPISEMYYSDERRLKELEGTTRMMQQMALNVRAAKDLQAATQPAEVPDAAPPEDLSASEGLFPVPPAFLPDMNDTFPEGALAAWEFAIFKGDVKTAQTLAVTDTAEQAQFLKTALHLVECSDQLSRTADAKFQHASEKFKYGLINKSQPCFVLQNIGFSAKTVLGKDGKTATVTVHSADDGAINSGPSGLLIEYRLAKIKDLWRVTTPENVVSIPRNLQATRDWKLEDSIFAGMASDEQKLSADLTSGKFNSLQDLIAVANSRLAVRLQSIGRE